ncbi:MAG: glycosyltransferase [Chthoniobacterales bacterium]|nr:glycosyltransferase [Chthoniobacterales bacterium]
MPFPSKLNSAEHLMVLPVPMRVVDAGGQRKILFEQQACNGLDRWCDSFESLYVAAPVLDEATVASRKAMSWADVETIPSIRKIEMIPLPMANSMRAHYRHVGDVRTTLRALIDRSKYLHFGAGGMWGGWAGIAAEEAMRAGRKYAVHFDYVEHQVVRLNARNKSFLRRVKSLWTARSMERWLKPIIEQASLVLCHGSDTYEYYKRMNRHARLIHNIHTTAADQVTSEQVAAKVASVRDVSRPIRVAYAGRIATEKAPIDWSRALGHAIKSRGANIRATWLGDGPLRSEFERTLVAEGIRDRVETPGFTSDRAALLNAVREADLFVFTHVTPESPRCLIEALISATPIVGYESHYPAELIATHQGGRLTPMSDWESLGDTIADLANDRARVADLIPRARRDGDRFTSEAVIRERSELIKEFLSEDLMESKKAISQRDHREHRGKKATKLSST